MLADLSLPPLLESSEDGFYGILGGIKPRRRRCLDPVIPGTWVGQIRTTIQGHLQHKERTMCSLGSREGEQFLTRMVPEGRQFTDATLANWLVTFIL